MESFNGKLRDELLNVEIFYSLNEAKIMIENGVADQDASDRAAAKNAVLARLGLPHIGMAAGPCNRNSSTNP